MQKPRLQSCLGKVRFGPLVAQIGEGTAEHHRSHFVWKIHGRRSL